MFEAFHESDYRRFWTTQFVSNVGSWMQTVAQGYLVYRLTDSAFLLGFVGFASSIPSFFLMLFGGVLADHVDRRRVVKASQWAQALSALGLAISIRLGTIAVWQIVVAAIVCGIAISFSAPAWQAMVLDLLDDRSHLPNAIAMNSLQFQLSRALGPLLAGVTLSIYGSFWCFFFNALSFLPLIWVLGRLKPRQHRVESTGTVWERLRDGFKYVRRERVIFLLLCVAAAASAFGFPYLNLMPMVARRLYGAAGEARGLGIIMTAIGAGAMLGSLTLSVRTPPRRVMLPAIVIMLILFGAALSGVGYMRWKSVVVIMLALCGVSMVSCLALCNTTIQQRVPDSMRGRVLSMYTFSFYAFLPFGSLASGVIAEHYGIGLTLAILGGALLVSGLIAAVVVRTRQRGGTMYGNVAIPQIDSDGRF